MTKRILPLDPGTYARHPIHGKDRTWSETNCYVDVWVELLHAWGFEPVAALPFTVAIDFEGDQWTFFKFPLADLHELYGLDVQELAVWRPLVSHLEEQLGQGRPVLVELDSFYLPDTAGSAYRLAHVKSTVAANEIDVAGLRLGYFHSQGYYHLEGDDFVQAFHLEADPRADRLPPYVEFVKRDSAATPAGADLVRRSLRALGRQLRKVPATNPFPRFTARFASDLRWLADEPLETFHAYAFATLRQFGASYELAATYLRWLQGHGVEGMEEPARALAELAVGAKALQFQLARALARKRPLDLSGLDQLGRCWETALPRLADQLG